MNGFDWEKYNDKRFRQFDKIDATGANFRAVISERSDGKSYGIKLICLRNFFENGKECAIIRRTAEETRKKNISGYWEDMSTIVYEAGKHFFPGFVDFAITYEPGRWVLRGYTEDGKTSEIATVGHFFSLSQHRYSKSNQYPNVSLIVYEEFITSGAELANEFNDLLNMISTIRRRRSDVVVYLLGNTVTRSNKVLAGMQINMRDLKRGEVYLKAYRNKRGEVVNRVAVELAEHSKELSGEEGDPFFCFESPREMAIRNGSWEVDSYATFTDDEAAKATLMLGIILREEFCRLFIYFTNSGRLFVTYDRLPYYHGEYITLTDEETHPERRCYNFRNASKKIRRLCEAIKAMHLNGRTRFTDDLTGDDFSKMVNKL